jgi:hypothetical protein
VQTLTILGGNLVGNALADVNFAALLKNVPNRIHPSDHWRDLGRMHWHINRAHYLSAGAMGAHDARKRLYATFEPVSPARAAIELLATITGDDKTDGYDIVRRTFEEDRKAGMAFESARAPRCTTARGAEHGCSAVKTPEVRPPRATCSITSTGMGAEIRRDRTVFAPSFC